MYGYQPYYPYLDYPVYPYYYAGAAARGTRAPCASNLYDQNGRCHQVKTSLTGKKMIGDPSPVAGSNFDDRSGQFCQCWANVDSFGNIQDHNTCYPSHDDASNKTNGFPGRPLDFQGGDYSTAVPCPPGGVKSAAPGAAPAASAPVAKGGFMTHGYFDNPDYYVGWDESGWPYPTHQTGAWDDVTVGPHLISPLGMGYAWGQGLGLWGQKEKEEVRPSGGRDHGRDYDRVRRRDHGTDWSTFAWVGLGVVGVFGAIYLITRKQG